jgi:AcrR family transcriptional regulator
MMSTSDGTSSPQLGRPRDKSLDDALIRVTLDQLSQSGLENLSMARIGRLSGIPATSIYRRYPDVQSLVMAAIEQDLADIQLVISDQGSLRADLLAFLHIVADALTPTRARMLAGLLLPLQQNQTLAAPLHRKLDQLRNDGWRGIIERAVSRGELTAAALDADPLYGVAHVMIFYRSVVTYVPADAAYLDELLDSVLMPALSNFRQRKANETGVTVG